MGVLSVEWDQQNETKSSHVQGRKTQFHMERVSDENHIVGGHDSKQNLKRPQNETSELDIGDRVVISGQQHGVLRYLGPTHFQVSNKMIVTPLWHALSGYKKPPNKIN